jgi:hypothetical protein
VSTVPATIDVDEEKLPADMDDGEEKLPTAMEDYEEKLLTAMEDGQKLQVPMELFHNVHIPMENQPVAEALVHLASFTVVRNQMLVA